MQVRVLRKTAPWVVVMVATIGCGGGATSDAAKSATDPAANYAQPSMAKSLLEQIAQSGQIDSTADYVQQALEDLKKTDEAKAKALLSDLAKLRQTRDANAVKSLAREMASKL